MSEIEQYQFPELKWLRGGALATTVEHGIHLRSVGRWHIPEYQRPLVWSEEQNVRFLESVILGLPIGEYTLHQNPNYIYEVIDGQQRWNAIFRYVDNHFPVFGLYYRDLNETTVRGFLCITFAHRAIKGLTLDQRKEAYERLAYGGTPHER